MPGYAVHFSTGKKSFSPRSRPEFGTEQVHLRQGFRSPACTQRPHRRHGLLPPAEKLRLAFR